MEEVTIFRDFALGFEGVERVGLPGNRAENAPKSGCFAEKRLTGTDFCKITATMETLNTTRLVRNR